MSYEVFKIALNDLDLAIKGRLSFWAKAELIRLFAERDGVSEYYLCVRNGSDILGVMPIFEKRKFGITYTCQLLEYYYTPIDFFLNDDLIAFERQNTQLEVMKALAVYLKKHYFKVLLKLDIGVRDVRGFQWSGLSVEPLFTFRKRLSGYNGEDLQRTLREDIRKAQKSNLSVKAGFDIEVIKRVDTDLSQHKGRSLRQVSGAYMEFLEGLQEQGFSDTFILYFEGEPVSFFVVLKDLERSIIYAYFTATTLKGKEIGASAYCYDFMFRHYTEYEYFDFTGANTEAVAFFKSKFSCDLENYYKIEKKYLT
jgi:hypothetical protein